MDIVIMVILSTVYHSTENVAL